MNAKKGFTLVEMLIVVGLFSIIVTIAVGGFTNAVRTQRQVSSLISAESNVNLALEQMTRAMRTGYLFCHDPGVNTPSSSCADPMNLVNACTKDATTGLIWTCPAIDFYNAQGQEIKYFLENGSLMESIAPNGPISVTGDTVSVKYLRFQLHGQTEGDYRPPRITISLDIAPSSTDPAVSSSTFPLETSVSARNIDCTPPNASGKVSC